MIINSRREIITVKSLENPDWKNIVLCKIKKKHTTFKEYNRCYKNDIRFQNRLPVLQYQRALCIIYLNNWIQYRIRTTSLCTCIYTGYTHMYIPG